MALFRFDRDRAAASNRLQPLAVLLIAVIAIWLLMPVAGSRPAASAS